MKNEPILVGKFRKNSQEQVRVTLQGMGGYLVLDIRVWWFGNESWMPTRKGLTIRAEQHEELIKILEKVEDAIRKTKITVTVV